METPTMKIGIDIRSLTDRHYSGISEYTYQLLRAIFEIDKTNSYVLFYNQAKQASVPKFPYDNVEVQPFRYPNKIFNLSMALFSWPKIDKRMGGVDILFMPNHMFSAWSDNCRAVLSIHDLSFEIFPEFFSNKSRLWLKLINTKKLCLKANKIIAVSENTKRDLKNLYKIDSEKISVIHEGIDRKFKKVTDLSILESVKRKYNLPEKFLLYLGNIEPRKNIETLISAFESVSKKHPDVKLILAGSPSWKYKAVFKKAKHSSAANKIIFLGYIEAKDKAAIYSLAHIFVYPSFYEGFGLPPLEAMACETPTIASNTASLPEVIGQGAILISPNKTDDFSKSIETLLSDSHIYQQYAQRGKFQAEKFSWHTAAQQTIEVLKAAFEQSQSKVL